MNREFSPPERHRSGPYQGKQESEQGRCLLPPSNDIPIAANPAKQRAREIGALTTSKPFAPCNGLPGPTRPGAALRELFSKSLPEPERSGRTGVRRDGAGYHFTKDLKHK